MKSLFAKVLSLLLACFFITAVVTFLLFRWISHELDPHERHFQGLSQRMAGEVIEEYEEGNLQAFGLEFEERFNGKVWILDEDGNRLSPGNLPERIRSQITGYPSTIFPHHNRAGRFFIFAHRITGDHASYKVIMTSRRPSFGRNRFQFVWLPIVAVILGMVSASVLLSYWVLRPTRILRSTFREISVDNLESRVPGGITRRNDVFGDLGREFNQMTDRVQSTIENQNQLLRDVSHELRSPLARIQVAASLVEQKLGSNPDIDRMETEIGKLNNLIEDLVSLTRLKNRVPPIKEEVNLIRLLEPIIEDANFEFQQAGKTAVLTTVSPARLSGDSELLSRMLENIIRNGLRYTPEQETLEIGVSKGDGRIAVTVIDKGPGVSPELLERIFDPFYRADPSRDISEGHHGIGLTLAKTIAEIHGGQIQASNHDGGGLEVRIDLPGHS